MTSAVLDSSALMAALEDESGAEQVVGVLNGAAISAVNLSEVVAKFQDAGREEDVIREALTRVPLVVAPFDEDHAYRAGLLRRATRGSGLSLGDRACLSLARALNLPAYTADRAWADLEVDVRIVVIR